jgi:hypothetical protein
LLVAFASSVTLTEELVEWRHRRSKDNCSRLPPEIKRLQSPRLSAALTAPRLRALHRAKDIGSALKGAVNAFQRQLVNEVLGPLVTEFALNLGREGATPIQPGFNAGLLGRI